MERTSVSDDPDVINLPICQSAATSYGESPSKVFLVGQKSRSAANLEVALSVAETDRDPGGVFVVDCIGSSATMENSEPQ